MFIVFIVVRKTLWNDWTNVDRDEEDRAMVDLACVSRVRAIVIELVTEVGRPELWSGMV